MVSTTIDKDSRVAVYLRRSRDEDGVGNDEVLRNHRERMQAFIKSKDFQGVEWFEEVASGGNIEGRPNFKKLLSMVEAGRFDVVLVVDYDRLTRGDTYDRGVIERTFRSSATLIYTLSEEFIDFNNESDAITHGMKGMLSEFEKRQILKRFRAGKIQTVQNGRPHSGTTAFAYYWDKNDKSVNVNEEESKTYRMMVDFFLNDGMSGTQIAAKLNGLGIPAKRGGIWYGDTVIAILKNDFHTGVVHYRKFITSSRTEDDVTKYVSKLNEDQDTVISARGNHEALKSDFEHAEILQRIDALRKYTTNDRRVRNNTFRLSGLVYCPYCGKCQNVNKTKGRREHIRKCLKRSNSRTAECDDTRGISEDALFEAVISDMKMFRERLFNRRDIHTNEENTSDNRLISVHEEAIENATKRMNKQKQLFMNDIIDMDEMKEEKAKADAIIRQAETKLSELKQSKDFHDKERIGKQRELWSSEDLESLFHDEGTPSEINDTLRRYIVQVKYEYTEDNEVNVNIIYY